MLDWMFTKLGQKHVWVYGYKTYGSKNSPGVIWGYKGQNVNHVKNMKQLQFKILLCHLVDNNQSFKKVNGDLVI